MKKIYLSFCLTITITSVSCMQQEQQRIIMKQEQQGIIPVYITTTYQPDNQYPLQSVVFCEANQTGWQQLHAIANMTYQHNKPQTMQRSATNEFELESIYTPMNTTTIQQEKKPLLQTNYVQPDTTIMQELYNRAANIIAAEYGGSKYTQWAINDALIGLITTMNKAKNDGICEDLTGEFAYKQKKEWNIYKCGNIAPLVPLMFTLLKKYNTTIHKTGEQIPLHFEISTHTKQNIAFLNQTNVGDDIIQYPAFFQLHYTLRRAITEITFDAITTFIKYIYENNDISQEGFSDGSYKNFKNEFHTKVYNYLLNSDSLTTQKDLYMLIQMIDKAKELGGDIDNENDLVTNIDDFFTDEPVMTKIFSIFNASYATDNIKKRIILFCKLIKKYNQARQDYKITPTLAQFHAYFVKRFLDIPLPEPVCNNTHLDENFYAFEEFEQLHDNTKILMKLSADKVNEQYAQLHTSLNGPRK